MKKLRTILSVVAGLFVTFAFAGCKNPDSTGGNSSSMQTRAVYQGTYESDNGGSKFTVTRRITFEADGTFTVHDESSLYDADVATGTYTGNAAVDGTITATVKKIYGIGGLVDYTDDDATTNITISNGKFTVSMNGDTAEYTRQ